MKLLTPFTPRIGGGGIITAVADYPGQALFWELVSFDPITGLEGAPQGSLKWDHTKADKGGLAANPYLAPVSPKVADIWYSGCFDGITGVTNGTYGDGESNLWLDRVFQNFYFPTDGLTIRTIYYLAAVSTYPGGFTPVANWEIRQNVSEGNAGILLYSGTSPYTLFDTGIVKWGLKVYKITLTSIDIPLAPGKYYVAAWLNGGLDDFHYILTTSGTEALGITDDNDAFVDDSNPLSHWYFILSSHIYYLIRKLSYGITGETLRVRDRVKVRYADA